MGDIRSECKDESPAEISLKLYEELGISRQDTYNFWKRYQEVKKDNEINIHGVMNLLYYEFDPRIMHYFAALAMEIISKEIIEGIQIDK